MNKKILCIYHGNCADGFTSAWVLRNALGEENVDFVAGTYGQVPAFVDNHHMDWSELAKYEVVYLVDFSYKRPVLLEMAKFAKNIIIIDHHKTAQEDLVDLPDNVECHFDMEHSGAMLTWMYFVNAGIISVYIPGHNSDPSPLQQMPTDIAQYAPILIQRVEDRDLWKFKFSDTRAVAAKMFSHEYTFENWDRMAAEYTLNALYGLEGTNERNNIERFLAEGEAIERKHLKDINELLVDCKTTMEVLGHTVPCANLPYTLVSDAASMMAIGELFAVGYFFTGTHIKMSFRSEKDKGMDVALIAQELGGGGHKNSAGVNLTFEKFWELIEQDTIVLQFTQEMPV